MLRSEAIGIIKRGLGFRQTQDAAIIAALQSAQRDLEAGKTLPNWLLVFDQPISVTAGTAVIAMPTGFLRLHEEYEMYFLNDEGQPVNLPRKNPQEAQAAYAQSEALFPAVFVIESPTSGRLVPTPTSNFTAYLTYYRAADVLNTETENAWLRFVPNYLVGLAGMKVAGDLRDAGALQSFTSMAKLGGQGYMGEVVEQELAGRPLIMGRNN